MSSVWVVSRNSDLTEGRGSSVFVGLFSNEAAAQKAALGIDVMGTNGLVKEMTVHDTFESWFKVLDGWERDAHVSRLRKARQSIDELLKAS